MLERGWGTYEKNNNYLSGTVISNVIYVRSIKGVR